MNDAQCCLMQYVNADTHKVVCPFVREHGAFFEPSPLPKEMRSGQVKACFANSYRLLKRHGKTRRLVYVEGYAVSRQVMYPQLHAWCVDHEGKVYDPTWGTGQAYFGVAFKTAFVMGEIRRRERSGDLYFGVLDDCKSGFPVVRGLADRPDVWKHEGTEKVSETVVDEGVGFWQNRGHGTTFENDGGRVGIPSAQSDERSNADL